MAALVLLAVVASIVGIGVLCALVSPYFTSLALIEGLVLGYLLRDG